jgi:hypothetical protein
MYRDGLYFPASRSFVPFSAGPGLDPRENEHVDVRAAPIAMRPIAQERPATHYTGGCAGLRLRANADLRCGRSEACGESRPTYSRVAKVRRRFCAMLGAKRRKWPARSPPLDPTPHGLRLCVQLARITESDRACPRRRASKAPSPQPRAGDTPTLLRPAALAQMARPPFRGIAELPDEPQDKSSDRENDNLPRHKKQEDHPSRLMHDAAPCCR